MARLGSSKRPIIVRVESEATAAYVAETCNAQGWQYIIGFESPEDLTDLENALHPSMPVISEKTPRNAPCPCGSGKKYKQCCAHCG